MAEAAYENPLIPHARLRQIYLAMAQVRELGRPLPKSQRARDSSAPEATGTIGLEACLVSTSIDLGSADLVSDAVTGRAVDFLRGAGTDAKPRRSRKPVQTCGAASPLPFMVGVADRLWAAIGAAAALKAAAIAEKLATKPEGEAAKPAGVVISYVQPGESTPAIWRRCLHFASTQELPIVFVVMPLTRTVSSTRNTGGISAFALTCNVPGIAVDADDAVALYRVAQESIGRARAGGGPALMECVPFVLASRSAARSVPRAAASDAIAGMAQYMLHRKVVNQAWIDRRTKAVAKRLSSN